MINAFSDNPTTYVNRQYCGINDEEEKYVEEIIKGEMGRKIFLTLEPGKKYKIEYKINRTYSNPLLGQNHCCIECRAEVYKEIIMPKKDIDEMGW